MNNPFINNSFDNRIPELGIHISQNCGTEQADFFCYLTDPYLCFKPYLRIWWKLLGTCGWEIFPHRFIMSLKPVFLIGNIFSQFKHAHIENFNNSYQNYGFDITFK